MKHPAIHEAIFQLFYDIGACLYKSGELDNITLPTMELRAMRAVKTAGQASPAEIASVLKRDRAQVTRLISELTEKGMLVSKPNP
ncbi:MAG: MarR family transcriptional regulator, partial [Rhodobacteraceae bacterium]|nr:MarR family transcriptional regulator [Paracoccaceae bacterium]